LSFDLDPVLWFQHGWFMSYSKPLFFCRSFFLGLASGRIPRPPADRSVLAFLGVRPLHISATQQNHCSGPSKKALAWPWEWSPSLLGRRRRENWGKKKEIQKKCLTLNRVSWE